MPERKYVKDYMSFHPLTVHATSSVGDAAKIMQENKIRHLPVFNDMQDIVGVVSDRDLKNAPAAAFAMGLTDGKKNQVLVKEVMTAGVQFVLPNTLLREAAQIMVDNKVSALPVLQDPAKKKIAGIISATDMMHALVALDAELEEQQPAN